MEAGTADIVPKTESLERNELINSIVAQNNLRFEEFIKNRRINSPSLDIPDKVLPVLIPKALYRKASDPTKVEFECWGDENSLELEVNGSYSEFGEKPLRKGTMMYLIMELFKTHPQTLIMTQFEVSTGLRDEGIGTEFYERLARIAQALGFRFVVGENRDSNIDFFVQKFGRVPLKQIRPDLRKSILPIGKWSLIHRRPSWTTVQFLYPEDKARFVKPS